MVRVVPKGLHFYPCALQQPGKDRAEVAMGLGRASTPQVVKCPDHTARAEIHAAVTTLSRVIERVSRPKHFAVELAKRIDDNFLDRGCNVAWIPWHQPQRNM